MTSIFCIPQANRTRIFSSFVLAIVAIGLTAASQAETDIAAVFAATGNGYKRIRLPNGSFKPETFTFAEGGRWNGQIVDASLDKMPFLKVAQIISVPLRQQNYVMSADPKTTELMIMVFWGLTTGADNHQYTNGNQNMFDTLSRIHVTTPVMGFAERLAQSGPVAPASPIGDVQGMMQQADSDELAQELLMNSAENAQRDRNNVKNAAILGFWQDYDKTLDLPSFAFTRNIIEELEADRYFVVLKAYDFQLLRAKHQKKLLWESRFSVRERNNRFDQMLPIMALRASKWFGQDSKHLLREPIPVGHVEVGTPIVVEPAAAEPVK